MSARLTSMSCVRIPDREQLVASGVTCNREITHFSLHIPRALQWHLLGDISKATAHDAEYLHEHIFHEFGFRFDKPWASEPVGDETVFYQALNIVLLGDADDDDVSV